MAPFLSATTWERAPMLRASLSIWIQASQALQSWAMPFWCSAQRSPATNAVFDAPLAPHMPAEAPCIPQPVALPVLPAVAAEVPLALQPGAPALCAGPAAVAASFSQAAFIAGVHCAAISALQPAAPFAVFDAVTALIG